MHGRYKQSNLKLIPIGGISGFTRCTTGQKITNPAHRR